MGRSRETYGKKEVRSKQAKKRKDKENRRLEKKEQGKKSMDDMIAYVDENGDILSTPPDDANKEEIDAESIEIGVPKKDDDEDDKTRKGVVNKYDDSKGYGFIVDSKTKDSIFVHVNDCVDDIDAGVKVEFTTEKGMKGLKAVNVKVV